MSITASATITAVYFFPGHYSMLMKLSSGWKTTNSFRKTLTRCMLHKSQHLFKLKRELIIAYYTYIFLIILSNKAVKQMWLYSISSFLKNMKVRPSLNQSGRALIFCFGFVWFCFVFSEGRCEGGKCFKSHHVDLCFPAFHF